MPLKTWAPYERLLSADLNANFALVAAGQMPGVNCAAGAPVAMTNGSNHELAAATPTTDTSGYWNAGAKRIIIPAGLEGLYLISATVEIAGATQGESGRLQIMPWGGAKLATFIKAGGGIGNGIALALTPVAAATQIYVQATSWGSTPGSGRCLELVAVRLATFEAIGALMGRREDTPWVEPLPAPEPEPEPDPEETAERVEDL